ncbi:hypothetical protein KKG61_03295 [bacterium]|nr:hypothetical protein [bacterium]MBU1599120.1 hypothetical protein [bacterium]
MKSISRLIVTLLLILWTSPCVSKEKAFIACIKSEDLSSSGKMVAFDDNQGILG